MLAFGETSATNFSFSPTNVTIGRLLSFEMWHFEVQVMLPIGSFSFLNFSSWATIAGPLVDFARSIAALNA